MHALACYAAQARPIDGPPAEILDESSFRAGRAGVVATLPDDDCRMRSVPDLTEEMVDHVRPAARELRCETQLDGLAELLSDGGGAGVQRSLCRDGDIASVLEGLVERAGQAAASAAGS